MAADHTRILLAMPVFNEAGTVDGVLRRVRTFARDILVVDDGSTDATPEILARHPVTVIRHPENRGYGHAMQEMLRHAQAEGHEWVITMDCDEQHEPGQIPDFVRAIDAGGADVVSGSRYLREDGSDDQAPEARRLVNRAITNELNARLDLGLTDAFCGFKAYRVAPSPTGCACARFRCAASTRIPTEVSARTSTIRSVGSGCTATRCTANCAGAGTG